MITVDASDIVENFADNHSTKPAIDAPLSNAQNFHQTSTGRFTRHVSSKRTASADTDIKRFFSSLLAAAELSLVVLACVWVYGVTAEAPKNLEPALSTSVRFFLVIACLKTVMDFSELKTTRNALAPILYLAAYTVAIAAAPDDTEISGIYKSLVWTRAALIWLAFVVSKLVGRP